MKKIVVGVDASRNRSGGAEAYLIGILSELNPLNFDIKEVHLWAPESLSNKIEDFKWLVKHPQNENQKSLIKEIWWQSTKLIHEVKSSGCDVLFTTDASTFCRFKPMIVLSQDMLSYEPGVMRYLGISMARLRALAILFVQNSAFRFSDGVIFLTKYASEVIQKSSGPLLNVKCIPHGVGSNFRSIQLKREWPKNSKDPISCIYISNAEMYKHQWIVVKALSLLRSRGINITLQLVGGGKGRAQKLVNESIEKYDPDGLFVEVFDFMPHEMVPEYLSNSNIFVFASSCENMPVTLIEGMSSGLPVACSMRGPMPEVLEDGGVYFDPEDCDSIVDALENIIYNKSVRLEISRRAKKLSSQYSWGRCSDETWKFIVSTYRGLKHD